MYFISSFLVSIPKARLPFPKNQFLTDQIILTFYYLLFPYSIILVLSLKWRVYNLDFSAILVFKYKHLRLNISFYVLFATSQDFWYILFLSFYSNSFFFLSVPKDIFFIAFRERERKREREKHWCKREASICCLHSGPEPQQVTCLDGEQHPQPFGYGMTLQPPEPHRPGLDWFLKNFHYHFFNPWVIKVCVLKFLNI